LALALRETFFAKKLVLLICRYNLSVPRLAAAMMMVFLLSQTGFLSSLTHQLGLTESVRDFPWLVYDSKGIGLSIVFVWKFTPYIALAALGVLQGASLEYEHQAATLGIGKFKRLIHIILPNVVPAISTTAIIVFAAAFGDYETPAILGAAQKRSVSVMLYLKYLDPDMQNRPEAYAMMVLTSAVLMTIILIAWRLAAIGRRKRGL
jgi:putative spermidine/putrescine transport system permease protein